MVDLGADATFEQWLAAYHKGQGTAFGDLAEDVPQDECWPRPTTLESGIEHLHGHGAVPNAFDAFRAAFAEYELWRAGWPHAD